MAQAQAPAHKGETVPLPQNSASASKTTIPNKVFSSGVQDSAFQPKVFRSIGQIFQNEQFSDIMLMAEGQSIPCHRLMLAAASEYFQHKITASMEGEGENHNLLEIEGIKFHILQLIVSYLYAGFISLTVDNANDVIAASKLLKLKSLYKTCEQHLKDIVDVTNCITLYKIAKVQGVHGLRIKAHKLMLETFIDVVAGEEFLAMTEQELAEYIQSDDLHLPNENNVFTAVVAWIGHDPEKRKLCMDSLIEHIRLPYCTDFFLKQVVSDEPLMKTSVCYQLLMKSLSVPGSPGTGSNQVHTTDCYHCSITPRIHFTKTKLLCISRKPGALFGAIYRVFKTEKVPHDVELFSACVTDGGVLVTGGEPSGNEAWLWSNIKGSWESLPRMNTARCRHASVCVGGHPYVLGGEGFGGKLISSVEHLNQENRIWQFLPDMPVALRHQVAVSCGQYIYVFGGVDTESRHKVGSYKFSSMQLEWNKLKDMPEICHFGSGVAYKDTIFIVGGFGRCCLQFKPMENQWSTLAQCAYEHADAPSLVWRGKILVCGGRSRRPDDLDAAGEAGWTSVMEEYDPSTDTWSISQHKLPAKLSSNAVFSIFSADTKY